MSFSRSRLIVIMSALLLALPALAQEKSMEEQFQSLAQSRTKAELAVRNARDYFSKGEATGNTRTAFGTADRAHNRVIEAYRKAAEAEQRRPEENRNLVLLDELVSKIQQAQTDWEDRGKDNSAIEARYREAANIANGGYQIFNTLNNLESGFKDTGTDLVPVQAAYEALAKRVNTQLANAQKAVADAQAVQKSWETRAEEAQKAIPTKK